MSVRDLSILARHIIYSHVDRFPLYGERSFTWNNIAQNNRNPLLVDYQGADGLKTGYTREAGYGLVGTASRNGRRLVLVVAGLTSAGHRKEDAQRLLDWGFRQFKTVDVFERDEIVSDARVWGGTENWVGLVTEQPLAVGLSDQERETVEVKLSYQGPLHAPVKAGTPVGEVRVLVRGKVLARQPLLTTKDVPAVDSMWQKAWDSALIMIFGG
jgi:D-alanyl-D-alanine carboxypeptidase (penicillin-binding protein 5/6)